VAGNDEEGIERQIKQMCDLIRQRVDIIIVQATDNAALVKPLMKANALGIPVTVAESVETEEQYQFLKQA